MKQMWYSNHFKIFSSLNLTNVNKERCLLHFQCCGRSFFLFIQRDLQFNNSKEILPSGLLLRIDEKYERLSLFLIILTGV